jgi:hypothetical protein
LLHFNKYSSLETEIDAINAVQLDEIMNTARLILEQPPKTTILRSAS